METLTKINHFRFWCQKVLPLVYDESLSYYELLCKVVDYLNHVITDMNATITNIEELTALFNTLKDYVDNYFENLNVQEEINNKLDAMAENGTLATLVLNKINLFKETIDLMPYGQDTCFQFTNSQLHKQGANIYYKNDIPYLISAAISESETVISKYNMNTFELLDRKYMNELGHANGFCYHDGIIYCVDGGTPRNNNIHRVNESDLTYIDTFEFPQTQSDYIYDIKYYQDNFYILGTGGRIFKTNDFINYNIINFTHLITPSTSISAGLFNIHDDYIFIGYFPRTNDFRSFYNNAINIYDLAGTNLATIQVPMSYPVELESIDFIGNDMLLGFDCGSGFNIFALGSYKMNDRIFGSSRFYYGGFQEDATFGLITRESSQFLAYGNDLHPFNSYLQGLPYYLNGQYNVFSLESEIQENITIEDLSGHVELKGSYGAINVIRCSYLHLDQAQAGSVLVDTVDYALITASTLTGITATRGTITDIRNTIINGTVLGNNGTKIRLTNVQASLIDCRSGCESDLSSITNPRNMMQSDNSQIITGNIDLNTIAGTFIYKTVSNTVTNRPAETSGACIIYNIALSTNISIQLYFDQTHIYKRYNTVNDFGPWVEIQ